VVAGVIGRHRFIYDLWGDTVNTASRMEAHGLPGRIQVTDAVRRQLDGRFDFEDRGEIEVKGKGRLRTHLVVGRGAIAPRS
jgi:class 3 adenylate cyclase